MLNTVCMNDNKMRKKLSCTHNQFSPIKKVIPTQENANGSKTIILLCSGHESSCLLHTWTLRRNSVDICHQRPAGGSVDCQVHEPQYHRHYNHQDPVCSFHQYSQTDSGDDKGDCSRGDTDDISEQSRRTWCKFQWDIPLCSVHHIEHVDTHHTHHHPVQRHING